MAIKQSSPSVFTFGILDYMDDRHSIVPEVNVEDNIYKLHISILHYDWGLTASGESYRYMGYVIFPNAEVMKVMLTRFDLKEVKRLV